VLGSGTAYAATGGTFKLGSANTASRTTTLTNAYGTALYLRSKAGRAPLTVNSKTRVPNLNSDLLDGKDSTGFASSTARIGTVTSTGEAFDLDGDGNFDAVSAIAQCPAGSQLVGGGGLDATDDGQMFWSAPSEDNRWVVASTTQVFTQDNIVNVEATARCWNPRANVADSQAQTLARVLTRSDRTTLQKAQR
jgi:hypothetical protein